MALLRQRLHELRERLEALRSAQAIPEEDPAIVGVPDHLLRLEEAIETPSQRLTAGPLFPGLAS